MVDDNDVTGAFETFVEQRLEDARISRASLLRRGVLAGAGLGALPMLLSQVGPAMAATGRVEGNSALAALIAAAQKEGTINTITLPPTWANYGEIMSTFKSKYKLKLTDAIPDGTSAQENQAIISQKGSSRAPDVLDVGPSFAEIGKQQKLYQPYKNSNWATIPANMKDPQGYWVGDYWGVISFGTNVDVAKTAPADWSDLKNPMYKNMVALGGDPRQAGEAFAAVFAASLANGGSLDDITPGIQFFADLKTAGNFITTQATSATKASGQTPIVCGWDYLQLADRDTLKGKVNVTVTVPKTGVFGNYYCQAISAHAPHPNASKLWQEFLYSDAGQLLWLKGYTHPARFTDMAKRKVIPAALLAKLPPAQDYKTVKFPSLTQAKNATTVLAAQWGPKVPGAVALSATLTKDTPVRSEPGPTRSGSLPVPLAWLGAVPFFAYALCFLLIPAGDVMVGAFRDDAGHWTLHNVDLLRQQQFLHAYENTLKLGVFTALVGGLAGGLLCYFALHPAAPAWLRQVVTAFSSVASQFGGVPLAFFFISSLGTLGVVTRFLHDQLGFDLYAHGFTIFGFWGVFLAYVYFQVPLMVLVVAPAIDGLKTEWREAAESLGATGRTYWLKVGIPVLAPSVLGAMVLLFGNAVAAQATAYALTSGGYNLVTNEITNVMNGNVLSDPHAGHALALGLVLIIVVAMLIYLPLQRRAARWMR